MYVPCGGHENMKRMTTFNFTDKMFNRPGHISQLSAVGAIITPPGEESEVLRRRRRRRRMHGGEK